MSIVCTKYLQASRWNPTASSKYKQTVPIKISYDFFFFLLHLQHFPVDMKPVQAADGQLGSLHSRKAHKAESSTLIGLSIAIHLISILSCTPTLVLSTTPYLQKRA